MMRQETPNNTPDDYASLEKIGTTYAKQAPQDRVIRELIVKTFEPYLNASQRALQLGFAEGIDTGLLAPRVSHLDVVEGNRAFFEAGQKNAPSNTTLYHDLFETFLPSRAEGMYDAVFIIYVLEHVQDPVALLGMARRLLAPSGHIFVVVPNAQALSRQLALRMGVIPSLYALTEQDVNHGHRRVYDRPTLVRDLKAAHLRISEQGGVMLKILADFQLNQLIEQEILGAAQIDGLYKLGFDYPDLCGSLYAVCEA